MKAFIIVIVIGMIGLVPFGFNKEQDDNKTEKKKTGLTDKQKANINCNTFSFTMEDNSPINSNETPFFYYVQGKYRRTITREKMNNAELVSDLVTNYPDSWINEYNSVEVKTVYEGKEMTASGLDAKLTAKQKSLFKYAENYGSIEIEINYKDKNTITNEIFDEQMNIQLTVVPDQQAEFVGGTDKMLEYFRANSEDKVNELQLMKMDASSVSFTINENGDAENVETIKSSGSEELDRILIEMIENMPEWIPAKDLNGNKLKQHLEMSFGVDMC